MTAYVQVCAMSVCLNLQHTFLPPGGEGSLPCCDDLGTLGSAFCMPHMESLMYSLFRQRRIFFLYNLSGKGWSMPLEKKAFLLPVSAHQWPYCPSEGVTAAETAAKRGSRFIGCGVTSSPHPPSLNGDGNSPSYQLLWSQR